MKRDATPIEPSTVFPWAITIELMDAGRKGDMRRIDAATDRLVAMGKCRPRADASLFGVMHPAKQNVWSN